MLLFNVWDIRTKQSVVNINASTYCLIIIIICFEGLIFVYFNVTNLFYDIESVSFVSNISIKMRLIIPSSPPLITILLIFFTVLQGNSQSQSRTTKSTNGKPA